MLELKKEKKIAYVILQRSEVHNALNAELISELNECFKNLSQDEMIRAVILKGEGKSFCAGADLNYMKAAAQNSPEENLAEAKNLHEMLYTIYSCPKVVISQVQGAAIGGGMGLVAVSDFVVAEENAQFAFSELRLGIVPAVIAPFVMTKLSFNLFRKLSLRASRFSAEEAADYGIVDCVLGSSMLDAGTQIILEDLLKASPMAVAEMKRLSDALNSLKIEAALELTGQSIAAARASADGQEGMAAFLEKRKANWID